MSIRRALAGIAVIGMLTSGVATAQRSDPSDGPTAEDLSRLDAYVRGVAAAGAFSGVVLVARDGRLLYQRAFGDRDEKAGDPLTVETRFDLASAGKMFTITAVLQQIARGRLTLDASLGSILTDYPDAATRDVTIRQLLTHTAGVGDTDALFYPDSLRWRTRPPSVGDLVALYGKRPLAFPPGSKQEYSNHAMTLLGRVVEVLSGMEYRAYVAQHVFRAAGMDAAHADEPCGIDDPKQAVGYATVADERMPNCFATLDGGWPAGGQSFSAADLLRFVSALREGRLGVPAALFRQATTPVLQGFGLGFFATDYGKDYLPRDLRWGHGGKIYGECIDVRTYETTGETIVTLGNNDSPACYRIAGFLHTDWRQRHAK